MYWPFVQVSWTRLRTPSHGFGLCGDLIAPLSLSVPADQLWPHSCSLEDSLHWTLWFPLGHLPLLFSAEWWWHVELSSHSACQKGSRCSREAPGGMRWHRLQVSTVGVPKALGSLVMCCIVKNHCSTDPFVFNYQWFTFLYRSSPPIPVWKSCLIFSLLSNFGQYHNSGRCLVQNK